MPPPPPLPYVFPFSLMLLSLLGCCACAGAVWGASMKLRKKAEKTPSTSVDAGGGQSSDSGLEGPKVFKKRMCTDVFCLLIFGVFWLGMLYIMYLATTVGEPYSVVYGKDYLGNRCGRGNFTNRPKIIFPRIDKDIMEQSAIATTAPWKLVLYGLCVESCPNITDPKMCFGDPSKCMVYDYGKPEEWKASGGSEYYFTVLPTISLANRCVPIEKIDANAAPARCAFPPCDNVTNPWMQCDAEFPTLWIPRGFMQKRQCQIKFEETNVQKLASQEPSPLVDQLAAKMGQGQAIVNGVLDAQDDIVHYGLVTPICLGFAWLAVLRFFAKTITYVMLAAIGVFLFMLTCYLFIITGLLTEVLTDILASNITKGVLEAASQAQDQAPDMAGSGDALGDSSSGEAGALEGDQLLAAAGEADALADGVTSLLPAGMAADAAASQEQNPGLWRLAAWACLIFTILYCVLMVLWRAKIRLAATLVKESSVVIKDRPASAFFPTFTLLLQIGLLSFFIIGMLFLGTADITSDHFTGEGAPLTSSATFAQALAAVNSTLQEDGVDAVKQSGYFTTKNLCYLYFLFGFLWTNACINNYGWTALSGSYSHWYFFRRDPKYNSRFPLFWSNFRTVKYHLGSIAFGSFVIATIQLARIIAMYIDKQTKQLQETNKAMKLVIKCVQCALFCLEKTLKFITAYCYIYVALQGTGFCRSCFATFGLIMSQPAQLAMNTLVRTILSLLQLAGIPLFCAFLINSVLTARGAEEPIYPTAIVLVMAFVIAKVFSLVFACVLDTLFVCCVRDKQDYKAAFMSDQLYTAFGFDPAEREGGGSGGKDAAADGGAGETKQQL